MTTAPTSSTTTRIWIVVLIALAALSFFAMRRSMRKAAQMRADTTVAAASPLKAGDEVKAVLEITAASPAASVEGNALEKQTETVYKRTGSTMKIAFDSATPVVMGKASDIHEGAVVHVTAKMGTDHLLHASQIVILTGYVKVQ